jgi:hypothetical protein
MYYQYFIVAVQMCTKGESMYNLFKVQTASNTYLKDSDKGTLQK